MSANIEHLRAVGRAATEGPWEWEADSCSDAGLTYTPARVWTDGGVDYWGEVNDDYVLARNIGNEDAEFIATARNEWDGLLDEVEALRAKVARVEEMVDAADVWVRASALRAALADQSAQNALSRPGTTSVASGATGDTEGAQRGAQGIEGGKA